MKLTKLKSVDHCFSGGLRTPAMITDERVDDIGQQISQVRTELDQFKDVVANAVSKLNARIKALEERLPVPRSGVRR